WRRSTARSAREGSRCTTSSTRSSARRSPRRWRRRASTRPPRRSSSASPSARCATGSTASELIKRESPHWDERPPAGRGSLLVIHTISLPPGEYGGDAIDDLFMGRLDPGAHPYFKDLEGLRVSSHYLIRRDGTVIEYVDPDRRAWHAGVSSWKGRSH